MSASARHVYACTPHTTRGRSVHIGGDPKNGENILYTCGNNVVIRSLRNPLNAELYTEHSVPATVARYAPSGFYIASADSSGNVKVWDTTQKEHPLKIELRPISGPIHDLQWSSDNQRIVVVGEGKEKFGAAFLWDSGASVGEITGHSKAILSCDIKQTRPFRLATGSDDFTCAWFEGPPFRFKHAMREHSRFVSCVRFSPDGNRVISVGGDKKGVIYDGKTGDKLLELSAENGHSGGIYSASWSPDGKELLTASGDKTCKIWDAATGECLSTFTFGDAVEHQQLGCLWQREFLISISLAGDINYLDRANPGRPSKIIKGHNKFITALAYDRVNGYMYTGSYDAVIIRWDLATGETTPMSGQGHTNSITRMHVQAGSLVTIAMDDSARVTPLDTREYSADKIATESVPTDLAVGKRDQDLSIVATREAVLILRRGAIVHTSPAAYQPTSCALSPDEAQVAVGGKDNNIYIYALDGDTLRQEAVLAGHRGALTAIEYSPDGQHLASADANREILVWDTATREIKIRGWVFHNARVNSLAWSHDGTHLASGSLDQNIIVWDVNNTAKRIQIKGAHQGGVNAVEWINDYTLASAGQDCALRTWALEY
jgi:WD40 repeat protein